jgi:DNA-binding Xre family transcriptional regulator
MQAIIFHAHSMPSTLHSQTGETPMEPSDASFDRTKYRVNIKVLMAIHGFKNAGQLHRALIRIGCEISHSQLNRIADGQPKSMNLDILNGLCHIFNCSPGDLFRVR